MNLKDKIVLITGSSQGIGKETAIQFAKERAKVIIIYNTNKKKGEETLKECKKLTDCLIIQLNITDLNSIKDCVEKVIDKFGAIDILINNAGVVVWKNFAEQSEKEIENQIDTNLTGLIKMTRAVLPYMKGQNEGIIINISSMAGKEAYEEITVYCATKFGVRVFTQSLAKELPKGIRVYCINPGMTATQMTNYQGMPPKKVAEVIVKIAKEVLGKKSGEDIDVENYLKI